MTLGPPARTKVQYQGARAADTVPAGTGGDIAMPITAARPALAGVAVLASAALAWAHGDVAPQPLDTAALPEVEEGLLVNPYRGAEPEAWRAVIDVGASGYTGNCARCHGLGAVSGGLAPDLRYLEAEEYGDSWYMERFVHGYTQNGVTKMPAFGEVLDGKAAWAIRSYIETRPDDDSMAAAAPELAAIRDELRAAADGAPIDEAAVKARLDEIAAGIETLSGAPVADSIASRASAALGGTPESHAEAAGVLTVGLSAAQ